MRAPMVKGDPRAMLAKLPASVHSAQPLALALAKNADDDTVASAVAILKSRSKPGRERPVPLTWELEADIDQALGLIRERKIVARVLLRPPRRPPLETPEDKESVWFT